MTTEPDLLAGCSVLLLEDEFVIAMDLEDLLLEWGCAAVTLANSIAEARTVLAAGSVDILLADFNLGDENSADLIADVKGSRTAVAILTGQNLASEVVAAMGNPIVLQKPVQPAQLRRAVTELARSGKCSA